MVFRKGEGTKEIWKVPGVLGDTSPGRNEGVDMKPTPARRGEGAK